MGGIKLITWLPSHFIIMNYFGEKVPKCIHGCLKYMISSLACYKYCITMQHMHPLDISLAI